jgi:hypothetical protein
MSSSDLLGLSEVIGDVHGFNLNELEKKISNVDSNQEVDEDMFKSELKNLFETENVDLRFGTNPNKHEDVLNDLQFKTGDSDMPTDFNGGGGYGGGGNPFDSGVDINPYSDEKVEINEDIDVINSLVGDKVREEKEMKADLLINIESLMVNLKKEGINVYKYKVDINTSYAELQQIYTHLSLLLKDIQYSTFAEKGMLRVCKIIEKNFRGDKKFLFDGFKPDYRGFTPAMNLKIRRMRPEVTQTIRSIINHYDINHHSFLIFDFLFSFVTYGINTKGPIEGTEGDIIDKKMQRNQAISDIRKVQESSAES